MFHPPRDRDTKRRESEVMTAKCSMCDGKGIVTTQTICDCKKLLDPPHARDWKPDERVLVEATIFSGNDIGGELMVLIDGFSIFVPISSIHPMTGRDGGK